jgi:hypothetical protein
MMWTNFFAAGGWGMYPTSIFGFLLVASGVLLVLRPERRFVALVVSLGVVTLGSGVLSCSVGVTNTLHYISKVAPEAQFKTLALGCAESMNNVVLALLLGVITALIAAAAALRASRLKAAS